MKLKKTKAPTGHTIYTWRGWTCRQRTPMRRIPGQQCWALMHAGQRTQLFPSLKHADTYLREVAS